MFKKQLLSQKTFAAEPGSIYALRTSHVTEVSRCLTRGSKDLNLVWARMLWSSYALRTRTIFWLFGHGCSGHRMLFEHERYYGLGTYALVIVCSSNTNVILVIWAWMLWSSYALGTRTLLWFWAWKLWSTYGLRTRTLLWFGHVCSGHRMLFEHERYSGYLGMDALVIVCSWNTNVIMGTFGHARSPNTYIV